MPLTPIFSVPCLSVDYDICYDCLFLSLRGQFALATLHGPTLLEPGLRVATRYPTWGLVLNDTTLTCAEAINWLVDQLLPSLYWAGVRHWTWVCSSTPRSHQLAEQVAKRLPQLKLTVFSDLEHAATWLQRASRSNSLTSRS